MAIIMVVDDSNLIRYKCLRVLVDRGYEVVEARNGVEALEKYQWRRPDAVLMDIAMPMMDGIQALKQIIRINPNAQVAMVSALGQKAMVLRAIKAGAKSFVVKPFVGGNVLDTVQRLIAGLGTYHYSHYLSSAGTTGN